MSEAVSRRAAHAELDVSANRARLSIVDVTFALLCLLPPLAFGHQLLNSDGDVARHIAMGQLMLREGLDTLDPFSHTQPLEPVLLTEWGSRLLYALTWEWAGLAGVCLLAGLLIGTSIALVVLFLRQRGVDPLAAYVTGMLVAVLMQMHWLARPHLFTFVGLACLLFLLEPGKQHRLLWFVALFVPWANLHGGFPVGLALIGTYLAGSLAEAWRAPARRTEWLRHARWYGAALAIAFVATCVTPRGLMTYAHIFDLLGNTAMTTTTVEFQSPDFHAPLGRLFLVGIAGMITILTLIPRRPALPRLFAMLLLLAAALGAQRNVPLFGLVAFPLLALHADDATRPTRERSGPLARLRATFREGEKAAVPGAWAWTVVLLMILLGAGRGSLAGARLVPDSFDARVFPVDLVSRARAEGITGTLFNQFEWGGYLTLAWPEMPIFIDGMTDYFPRQVLIDYGAIAELRGGWSELLDGYGIDLVLVPPGSPLSYQLGREGWSVELGDETAVLLRRRGEG